MYFMCSEGFHAQVDKGEDSVVDNGGVCSLPVCEFSEQNRSELYS